MERDRTKIHIFGRTPGWKLVLGAIISLLSFNLSLALVCLYQIPWQHQAEACDYACHCVPSPAMSHASGARRLTAGQEAGIAMTGADRSCCPSGSALCCHQPPPVYGPAAAILKREPPAAALELLRVGAGNLPKLTSPRILSPPRSRSLYLALSCLLI